MPDFPGLLSQVDLGCVLAPAREQLVLLGGLRVFLGEGLLLVGFELVCLGGCQRGFLLAQRHGLLARLANRSGFGMRGADHAPCHADHANQERRHDQRCRQDRPLVPPREL